MLHELINLFKLLLFCRYSSCVYSCNFIVIVKVLEISLQCDNSAGGILMFNSHMQYVASHFRHIELMQILLLT